MTALGRASGRAFQPVPFCRSVIARLACEKKGPKQVIGRVLTTTTFFGMTRKLWLIRKKVDTRSSRSREVAGVTTCRTTRGHEVSGALEERQFVFHPRKRQMRKTSHFSSRTPR